MKKTSTPLECRAPGTIMMPYLTQLAPGTIMMPYLTQLGLSHCPNLKPCRASKSVDHALSVLYSNRGPIKPEQDESDF